MKEFIQTRGYISKETPEDHIQVYSTKGVEPGKTHQILMFDTDWSMVDRTEAVLNTASQLLQEIGSGNRKDYKDTVNTHGIDMQTVDVLNAVQRFLGYIVGSSSWEHRKIESYDKNELISRLDRIRSTLERIQ